MAPADRFAGIAVILTGLTIALASFGIDIVAGQAMILSARFFPLLLSSALVVLGAILALRPRPAPLSEVARVLFDRRTLLLAGLLLLYYLSFRYIDFRVGAWLFLLLAMLVLGSRRPLELIVVPVVVSLAVYVAFRYGFSVLLPVWT